ncbi:MAG: thiamine phosphate synthase [Solirubrobacterales bacterium]
MSGQPTRLAPPESIGALRRHRLDFARLYLVCEGFPRGAEPEPLLRAALSGGAGLIQMRDKERTGGDKATRAAHTFRRLADSFGALFIVNDDPHLALELSADGVHLGQDDAEPAAARRVLGEEAIIGLSTHSADQIAAAQTAGVDYISVGPVWKTPTKPGRPSVGLELVSHAGAHCRLPFFAIGGIDTNNVAQVVAAGAGRLAVVRAIRDAEDPAGVAAALRAAVDSDSAGSR